MLVESYEILKARYSKPSACFSALLQLIAHKLRIPSQYDYATPTLTFEMEEALNRTLDLGLLREEAWDWLGEAALHLGLTDYVPYPVSRDDAIAYVKENVGLSVRPDDVIFDPAAGSGRLFLAMANLGMDCIMIGHEAGARPYRLLVINKYLYDLPAFVVHTSVKDPLTLNLRQANLYNPVLNFSC